MYILEQLWYGNISPLERQDFRREDYLALLDLHEKNTQRLLPTLNDAQKEDLKKMQDVEEEINEIVQCAAFISGFQLATQFMVAAFERQYASE